MTDKDAPSNRQQRRSHGVSPSEWSRYEPLPQIAPPSVREELLASIPMYDATSDAHEPSCDWPGADYSASAQERRSDSNQLSWTVTHQLSGAPGIEALLTEGAAKWAVEAHCHSTMGVWADTSKKPVTIIEVPRPQVGSDAIHLWPGVVVTEPCRLDASGTAWGNAPIALSPGRWLVRGTPIRADHDASYPLVFTPDPEVEPEGAVKISAEESGQDTRFVVRARPDRIEQLARGAPLIGCWATALAMLPCHRAFDISDGPQGEPTVHGSQIGQIILRRLEAEGIPLWCDKNAWDPMQAATAFVPLQAPHTVEDED